MTIKLHGSQDAAVTKLASYLVAFATLTATPVFAADIVAKAPAPAAAHSWSGFYVGGHAGYGWNGDPTVSYTPNDIAANGFTCGGAFGGTCIPAATFGISGGLIGLQAGYDWQPDRHWLAGVASDFSWTAIGGTGASNFVLGSTPPAASAFQATENVDWFGTLRGRLGWLATDKFLLYGTGGLAYGRVHTSANLISQPGANGTSVGPGGVFAFNCLAPTCFVGNTSQTLVGYSAGGGVAYAISPNVSLFAEYLYVNLGHITDANSIALNGGKGTPSSFTAHFSDVIFNVVRGGLNYKF